MALLSIAAGELYYHREGAAPLAIESRFARELIERDAASRRNTSWKHAEREDNSRGMISGAQLWGQRGGAPGVLAPPRFLHACAGGEPGVIYYLLSVARSIGLFRYHLDEQREVRLFHRSATPVLGMTYDADARRLILSNAQPDGSAHLDVYDEDGNHQGTVTGGDCMDGAPSRIWGLPNALVYASAGVARHPQAGHVVALGHSVINRLNFVSGDIDTVLEDPAYDFVAPRAGRDGSLYAIRRPVEKPVHEQAGMALKDTVLMPLRLGKAVFGYLNFFSQVYGKEPLRSAGGPRAPELDQDLGQIWLHGRLIELRKIKTDAQYAGNLVPGSWELIQIPPHQRSPRVLANHVAGFDLRADGTPVFTNGYDVMALDGDRRVKLARRDLVEAVAVLD
ncbi:hypothetical protein [Ottowia testudinis]|uniref:Uncharacterized protein n=1 Tax=Ottowia testudinis TaxID=2816950 RepID=A0A975CGZ6_9BURK|nr:hypothetical protein [Ottowia testudinis]QTD46030.1 hypothetical protein J1M35_03720 [Ottowia testudinis]